MTVLDSSLVRGADTDRLAGHDKILIIDLGSQVTQLIARRVREEKVYCEIVPFQKADEAFKAMRPTSRRNWRATQRYLKNTSRYSVSWELVRMVTWPLTIHLPTSTSQKRFTW